MHLRARVAISTAIRKENVSKKQIPKIDLNLINKKETKMSKMQNRIKKMNFQKQERKVIEELSDNDKYIIEIAEIERYITSNYENLKSCKRDTRPQHF